MEGGSLVAVQIESGVSVFPQILVPLLSSAAAAEDEDDTRPRCSAF